MPVKRALFIGLLDRFAKLDFKIQNSAILALVD
jgi:hypothetical protein